MKIIDPVLDASQDTAERLRAERDSWRDRALSAELTAIRLHELIQEIQERRIERANAVLDIGDENERLKARIAELEGKDG